MDIENGGLWRRGNRVEGRGALGLSLFYIHHLPVKHVPPGIGHRRGGLPGRRWHTWEVKSK